MGEDKRNVDDSMYTYLIVIPYQHQMLGFRLKVNQTRNPYVCRIIFINYRN